MSLFTTTLVLATCFGDSNGDAFDDLQAVQGTTAILSDVARAVQDIRVMHSNNTVDGIAITYASSKHDGAQNMVAHGTTSKCTDPALSKSVFTIGAAESVVTIFGRTDKTQKYGLRITSLSFSILNHKTGSTRTAGPFGSTAGTTFSVNVTGEFIALSGFAIDTDKSCESAELLINIALGDEAGGLYGLVFDTTNFHVNA